MIREENWKKEKLREFYDVKLNEEQLNKLELMEGLDSLVDRIYSKSVDTIMKIVNWDQDRTYKELGELREKGREMEKRIGCETSNSDGNLAQIYQPLVSQQDMFFIKMQMLGITVAVAVLAIKVFFF